VGKKITLKDTKTTIKAYLLLLFKQQFSVITRIFTHIFTYTYFQKIQTTLLEISYRTDPKSRFEIANIIFFF